MKNINWKVRAKSKTFWVALVPSILLLGQVIAIPFGYTFKIEPVNTEILNIVNAIFVVLTILGIVTDPTTKGITDSPLVMAKQEPTDTPSEIGQPNEKN